MAIIGPRFRSRADDLASSYTFGLYRPWLSAINPNENRLVVNVLVPVYEKTFRALWLVVPPVGFR